MKKRRKHAVSIGNAILWSFGAAWLVGVILTLLLFLDPHGALRALWYLLRYDATNTITTSPIYWEMQSRIAPYEIGVTSASFLAGGLVLGWLLKNEYGIKGLYRTAAVAALIGDLLIVGIIWGLKLMGEGFHFHSSDLPLVYVVRQLTAMFIWWGAGMVGAGLGRYLGTRNTARVAHA